MAIITTDEEKAKIASGELTYTDLIKERGQDVSQQQAEPVVEKSELEEVKEQLKSKNVIYKELILENRELRDKVTESVTNKANIREEISQLRKRKKELIGNAV